MGKCERCGTPPQGDYGPHDYCAKCSRDLCGDCMERGCCGSVPAQSGMTAAEELDAQRER